MNELGTRARAAYQALGQASADQKNAALKRAATLLRERAEKILEENRKDVETAKANGTSPAIVDRLTLTESRIDAMAKGLEEIAELPDPVGRELARWTRPNGLDIARIAVPLGVIGIIYESRPNVTADAAALCLKSGNAAILRGGSESFHSSAAIAACLHDALRENHLPETAVQTVPTTDREAVGIMLGMTGVIDVIIPRGGKSLTERVMKESRVPTLLHLDGNCHTYIHTQADAEMAKKVLLNAKMRRTGICGATESLLVDRAIAASILPALVDALAHAGCAVKGDAESQEIDARIAPATNEDWSTEYLDAVLSVKLVDGVEDAIAHINHYGSHHTDAIITEDKTVAEIFTRNVDSAIVMVNASTQFADGGEFGMGAEIGIATGRLHARGPVGANELTTYKYIVRGSGQVRPA